MKRLLFFLVCAAVPILGQTSRQGTYVVTITPIGGARSAGENNSVEVVLRDRGGAELFGLSKSIPYDVPYPSAAVFETGTVMLIHAFDGFLEFYDRSGSLIQTVHPLKEAGPAYERVMVFAVHDSTAAVLISEPGRESCVLAGVTDRGHVISQVEVPGTNASGVALSNKGLVTAAGTYRWEGPVVAEQTHFLSVEGRLTGSADAGFVTGRFSEDDSWFLALTKHQAAIVSVPESRAVSVLAADQGSIYIDGTWNGAEAVLVSAAAPVLRDGTWVYSHPVLRSLSREGETRLLQEIPSAEFTKAGLERIGDQVILQLKAK